MDKKQYNSFSGKITKVQRNLNWHVTRHFEIFKFSNRPPLSKKYTLGATKKLKILFTIFLGVKNRGLQLERRVYFVTFIR